MLRFDYESSGEKTSHTTDTWTFWGDDSDEHDTTKNCFYVHGSIDEVTRYYTGGGDRIIPADPLPEVHAWCDGSVMACLFPVALQCDRDLKIEMRCDAVCI